MDGPPDEVDTHFTNEEIKVRAGSSARGTQILRAGAKIRIPSSVHSKASGVSFLLQL